MPANQLMPNTTHTFELDFDDRIANTLDPNGIFQTQGFDVRTDGSFTTGAAVPEPGTLTLMVFGLAAGACLRKRLVG